MKIIKKNVTVKRRLNCGDILKYKTTTLNFPEIKIRKCGCGGIPKISQTKNGVELYNYCGEDFSIECQSCSILKGAPEAINGSTIKEFNEKASKTIQDLIIKWNKVFNNSPYTIISFSTRE